MPTLLFVDACVRGAEHSRTFHMCQAFLEEYALQNPGWTIDTLGLDDLDLRPFDAAMLDKRTDALLQKPLGNPMFDLAWQFAGANKILIGAPYWDMSFPAVLKTYVEHISVDGVTFHSTDSQTAWLGGLCGAEHLMYITTAGGPMAQANFGYDYFRGLCGQFGIPNCSTLYVEGLDLPNADIGALMSEGITLARQAARNF